MKTVTYDEMLWKLVPVEPTEEMLCAGDDVLREAFRDRCIATQTIYDAMLASTPAQPTQQEPMEAFLVIDLSRELGVAASELTKELRDQGIGNYSVNMALPKAAADAMRRHFKAAITHQAPPQQERKPMTNAPTEVEKLMDAAGLCRRCAEPTDTRGVKDVLAERQRQIKSEGYSPESDDAYWQNDLVKAAVCYAWPMYPMREGVGEDPHDQRKWAPDLWPWEARHWKPKDRRSNLVRAGALILAEIERLDRVERHHGIKE